MLKFSTYRYTSCGLIVLFAALGGCIDLTVEAPFGTVDNDVQRKLAGVWVLEGAPESEPNVVTMRAMAGQLHAAATNWDRGSAESHARFKLEEFTLQVCSIGESHLIFLKAAESKQWSVARFELRSLDEFHVFPAKTAAIMKLAEGQDKFSIKSTKEGSQLAKLQVGGNSQAFMQSLTQEELLRCFPEDNKLAIYRMRRVETADGK